MNLIYILLIAALAGISVALTFLFWRKKEELRILTEEKHKDIVETNKLLLEKSENELRLFFEFEAAVEESVKLGRETKSFTKEKFKELLQKQDEIIKLLKSNHS